MKITREQVAFYNENGYLKLDHYLTGTEVEVLRSELPKTVEKDTPRVVFESNGSIRSIFAPHLVNETYDKLIRLDRFVLAAEQLVENQVYLHQYKINTKKGLKGDWWEWHQDFPYWHLDDGIEEPNLVSIMIYLHDTDALNGALLVVPGSHKQGIVEYQAKEQEVLESTLAGYDHPDVKKYLTSLGTDLKFTVGHETLKALVEENDILVTSGKKGTVLFFHPNIFHASNTNLTPFDRDTVIITYNSIHNTPVNCKYPRPDYLVGKNYAPIRNLVSEI